MAEATIRTPGTVTVRQNGVTMEIAWEPDFGRRWNEQYEKAQFLFDEEVLRLMTPYVPVDTTMLRDSAIVASDIGGGLLEWATNYAAKQYYDTADSRGYAPLAGGHWGERCKADNLAHFEGFARKVVAI